MRLELIRRELKQFPIFVAFLLPLQEVTGAERTTFRHDKWNAWTMGVSESDGTIQYIDYFLLIPLVVFFKLADEFSLQFANFGRAQSKLNFLG